MTVELYDTTLRDGAQMEGLSLSVEDKLKITRKLDELGVHYIEGGWPGSNPKDAEFFVRTQSLNLQNSRLAAFGSTRKAGGDAASDTNLRALLDAPTAFDRRAFLPALLAGDAILSRRPFIPSAKAVLADALADTEWRRVIPPLPELPLLERQRLVADFRAWDATLPPALRSLPPAPAAPESASVVDLRRA